MRTRTQRLFRVALASLSLGAAAIIAPRDAHAEVDTFGLGNGHSGAYVAAAADEVINAYAPLTADAAVGATSVTIGTKLGAAAGFAVGDLVMVWRATGVTAAEAPSGTQMPPLNLETATMGAVGRFELARVSAVTATTLTFTKPLTQAFAKDLTQVVSVPEYTTMTATAGTGPAALAWQTAGTGFAGGIVAFLASGVATIDGHVNADARGFRGGKLDATFDPLVLNCMMNDGTEATGYAAKGEGVVATEFGGTTHGGKGNRANGAGGGNCAENGGGGGGNAGKGGAGGNSIVGNNQGGLGGSALDYSLLTRLGMGGGGGAGEQKNGLGSGGGIGGGVVFARVRSLSGSGQLTANGEAAANAQLVGIESDGAGGGGAGGSIILRAVGDVECATAETKGGNGGNTAVVGLATWGPGGGGSGGRVLIQAHGTSCPIDVTAGTPGTAGLGAANGATAGGDGATQNPPSGNFCFSNTAADPQCVNNTPVCDPVTGVCNKCTGPFGGGSAHACQIDVDPVCATDGSCNPCLSDFGVNSESACQLTTAPYCFLTGPTTGACGKCTTSADCAGGLHGGTACEPASGACGAPCTMDSECKTTEWCAGTPGVCIPKTPNGEHVPAQPPINGMCTMQNGQRVCLSAVCEMDDDLCGLHNGSPCDGKDAECRSNICFPADTLCGKPAGEPCALNGDCRSDMCVGGVCSGCVDDTNCGTGMVCDKARSMCVAGCREVAGKSNCIAPQQCSKHDGTIGTCVDLADGGADAGTDAGPVIDDSGSIEGGGCACRTSMPISGSPLALAAAVIGALVVGARRRRERTKIETKANSQERG
ncbi:MAG: hypothetical protein QOI41_1627 [Myxococcales bacterium]|nr:hypothetical protein [Myxococcales bacterium]